MAKTREVEEKAGASGLQVAGKSVASILPPSSTIQPARTRSGGSAPPAPRRREVPIAHANGTPYEKAMAGDGSVQKGRKFKEGSLYAAVNSQNGLESYFEVEPSSISINGGKHARYLILSETDGAKSRGADKAGPKFRINRGNARRSRTIIKKATTKYLMNNPGVALINSFLGARGFSEGAAPFLVKESGLTFKHGSQGMCLDHTIVNAVDRMLGREVAIRAEAFMDGFKGLIPALRTVQGFLPHIERRLNTSKLKADVRLAFDADKLKWLSERDEGMWLTRLRAGNQVDHCILVDGFKKEIVDPEEKYPLRLCVEALVVCGGGNASKLYVAEVRKLFMKPGKKQ